MKKLREKGRLSEKDVEESLREVRLALLEADVNFKVVRDFVATVKERAVGRRFYQVSLWSAGHLYSKRRVNTAYGRNPSQARICV